MTRIVKMVLELAKFPFKRAPRLTVPISVILTHYLLGSAKDPFKRALRPNVPFPSLFLRLKVDTIWWETLAFTLMCVGKTTSPT